MALTGYSSYIPKSSYTTSPGYGTSGYLHNYHSKTYSSSSSYKPSTDRSRTLGTTVYRARDTSTSGYLRSPSNLATSSPTGRFSLESKRYGISSERPSRRDTYGIKTGLSSPMSHYSSTYSSSYRSPTKDYGHERSYGRFSQERTIDVSRDFRELSLGPRLPSLRRSSSQFDLMSSRSSTERTSVGRNAEEKQSELHSRITPRAHPTMGMYTTDRAAEKRLGGSELEIGEQRGDADTDLAEIQSTYGSSRSEKRSPSSDRWNSSSEAESSRMRRYSSVGRFSGTRASIVPKSVNTHSCSGLRNIGNTCFLNSILQCLAHTQPLLEYCLESQYEIDINREASRMKGVLITAYAELMNSMWNGDETVVSPTKFKLEVARFAKLFLGYNQQDAQEFLLYLLQGLHEDINRVRKKKKVPTATLR